MSVFEKVQRAEVPTRRQGRRSEFRDAIEAALADPENAVVLKGLTASQAGALYQITKPESGGRHAGLVKCARSKQPDGTYSVFLSAVQS